MNIEFRVIDKSNYNQCIKLKTSEEQKRFVATNIFSLVQSAYEPNFYPLGVYKNDKMVGFILYDFDDEINGWSMSRFMIDEKFQNQGIGKVALNKFIKLFIEKYGHIKLYTSAEVDNTVAVNLYESMGFEKKEVFEYEVDGVTYKEFRMLAQL
ncbi:GNAT family N-acetyltransferase [Romboutsia sedimentorum]|uniref:GNAT family N-acetyltransferase n=1 Tax=Romboutsia sedimentorum TaxID=1368474 RepID=A0ABT7E8T5_9FIRM|nr:GNAT family N-acetyltransferase [Romboutsia sedimentorum]MDK2562401.1 GNAT family N-acetyltransferase [Romboutsia sedimentorum]